ncbi:uncharacterized protein LOC143227494 [Tachypleus tridentatus]|uniref:uncharacterized protein LOC143227494 n=1 Tax=Tachypleus tridentatus TaxID=6853 RepID=UPI003FD1688A
MALYTPVTLWITVVDTCRIVQTERGDGFTLYVILMHLPPYSWTVKRRYNEFRELQEKLVAHWNVEKSLLPPKKFFGNQSETFIQNRQVDLEIYLQNLLHRFRVLPTPLANFLDFHKYEVRTIVEDLAETFFTFGDELLRSGRKYTFFSLQLHALTERLKLAEPPCSSGDNKRDISHLLEFISQLHHLKIVGSNDPVGQSNIIPNRLSFDISPFKSLKILERLLVSLEILNLSRNYISDVENLDYLHRLSLLDLSYNRISHVVNLHTKLGNIRTLKLHHNSIKSIQGLSRLYSVVELDLTHNEIDSIAEVEYLGTLPCLEILHLADNPVTSIVDFRPQALATFDTRADEVALDGEKATQKELDTIAVLQALKAAKEGRLPKKGAQLGIVVPRSTDPKTSASTSTGTSPVGIVSVTRSSYPSYLTKNNSSISELRYQVATLRRLGGSDWLRLYNQFIKEQQILYSSHLKPPGPLTTTNNKKPTDYPPSTYSQEMLNTVRFTPSPIMNSKDFSVGEMMLPELVTRLDTRNLNFKNYLLELLQGVQEGQHESSKKFNELIMVDQLDQVLWSTWVVALPVAFPGSITRHEIPLCVVLTPNVITLWKLQSYGHSFLPHLTFYQCWLPSALINILVGPVSSYLEFYIQSSSQTNLFVLAPCSADDTNKLIDHLILVYNLDIKLKYSDFTSLLVSGEYSFLSSEVFTPNAKVFFCERVLTNGPLEKETHLQNYFHFLIVTNFHLILTCEKMEFTSFPRPEGLPSPLIVLKTIDVKSNIFSFEMDKDPANLPTSDAELEPPICYDEDKFPQLRTHGYWLKIYFENRLSLCIRFLKKNVRTLFLEALTKARNAIQY